MSNFGLVDVGDAVRSYDFPEVEGRPRNCYVEGTVVAIDDFGGLGFDQYQIRVSKLVFCGEEIAFNHEKYAFPPVNGTPTWLGEADGVVKLSDIGVEA